VSRSRGYVSRTGPSSDSTRPRSSSRPARSLLPPGSTCRCCAPLGVDLPVAPSLAVLLRFSGPPGLVRTLVTCPEIEVRESSDGRLVVAADYTAAITQEALHRSTEDTLRRLKATFTGAEDVRLLDVSVGIRPVPADGLPIIGPLSHHAGVYVAVMHSAVTLVPVVGRLVAVELIHGLQAEELRGVRPDRFQSNPSAPQGPKQRPGASH
jgi:glycine/D-amino acid oxidase-like deaminating enzyme